MHDFIMVEDSELWDVVCDGPYVLTKVLEELPFSMPKTSKEYTNADRKAVEKNFRAKKILVCVIRPDEYNRISACDTAKEIWKALQTAHEGTTQVKQSKIDMLTAENKLVRKILSIRPSLWKIKVNAITEAKDLQELTIEELVGNLKTYEMKMKIDSERKEPKKEKNLVLKADNNDSIQPKKAAKRNLVPLKDFKRKKSADNVVKHALAAWGDSSSESEDKTDAGNNSMMAFESEENEYDSTFALMAQSDDNEDDANKEVNFRDVQRNMKSYSPKKLMYLANILIDAYHNLVEDKDDLILELGEADKTRDDMAACTLCPYQEPWRPSVAITKTRKKFNDADRKVIEKNFRAKKILVCGIGPDEYNRIPACQSAKEIWEALQAAHEGTT
ncbi:uncharacterized protein [Nicotiana sylvestris]|uniref:uncharacterized protein n=1 Tax=Nicotiana sylvestris TaxID=4096 RepID=UPI00388CBE62